MGCNDAGRAGHVLQHLQRRRVPLVRACLAAFRLTWETVVGRYVLGKLSWSAPLGSPLCRRKKATSCICSHSRRNTNA